MSLSALRNQIQNTQYPTVMRPQPQPTSRLDTLKSLGTPAGVRRSIEGGTLAGMSFAPNTTPLSSVGNFQPMDIPTFSARDFMPTNTLNQIQQVLNASPQINEQQLQQRAQTQTELLTNPQIEALRNQINAFKSLIPETSRSLQDSFRESNRQASASVEDVLRNLYQEAEAQGGLRSGAAYELSRRSREEASPLFQALLTDYTNTREQVIGALQSQQDEAQNLLQSIQDNRQNMTKSNYNALRDQAIQQFRQAQQAQQKFLQGIAQIEAGAKQSAASYRQESAAAYNQFMQQMIQQQTQQLAEDNLSQWTRFLTGSTVKNRADALRLLQENRGQIQSSLGQDGFQHLQKYVQDLGATWVNPNYASLSVGASAIGPAARQQATSVSDYLRRRYGTGAGYNIPPNISTTLGP